MELIPVSVANMRREASIVGHVPSCFPPSDMDWKTMDLKTGSYHPAAGWRFKPGAPGLGVWDKIDGGGLRAEAVRYWISKTECFDPAKHRIIDDGQRGNALWDAPGAPHHERDRDGGGDGLGAGPAGARPRGGARKDGGPLVRSAGGATGTATA